MSEFPFPYRFIAIEGNIGAGKTTLSRKIAGDFDCKLILEQFTDNPFLPFFYENPERYAFPVELFFMTERHKQLQELATQQELFQKTIVSDYFFWKTLLFARNNLNPEEFRLFQRLFQVLNSTFSKPDLLIYLYRSVDGLLNNIRKRNRSYEQEISPDYLANIQQSYLDFFHKSTPDFPILILDVEGADFLDFPEHYQALLDLLKKEYAPGVHRMGVLT